MFIAYNEGFRLWQGLLTVLFGPAWQFAGLAAVPVLALQTRRPC